MVVEGQSRRGYISAALQLAAGLAVLATLAALSRANYLLFHSVVELFAVFVAWCLFVVVWNRPGNYYSGFLSFLGVAYFWVGTIDLVHMLSYKGMGVIVDHQANWPTQFWIAARYLESASLLVAPLMVGRKVRQAPVFAVYLVVTGLVLASVFSGHFPTCYQQPGGLTPFKVYSEYLIIVVLICAGLLLLRKREQIKKEVWTCLIAAIAVTIASEFIFTLYVSVFGLPNMFGHLLKIVSFYLIYRGTIRYGVQQQQHRAPGSDPSGDGMVPICAGCKCVRSEQGSWSQIEAFLHQRHGTQFTHGICPTCEEQLYGKDSEASD